MISLNSVATFAPDLTVRPATLEDAPAVLALLEAYALKFVNALEEDLTEIITEWTEPGFDLTENTRVGFDAKGALVTYGIIYLDRPMVPMIDLYLHPARWETDTQTEPALIAWAMRRAEAVMPSSVPEEMRVAFSAWTYADDVRYRTVLANAGMIDKRVSLGMRIDFDAPPTAPAPVPGITIRAADENDDWRAVVAAYSDAWRDHRGYIERPFEERFAQFVHEWEPIYVPGAWLLALDGDTIVGTSLCTPTNGEDKAAGSIYTLAVRRAYRRRGIARALLLSSFVMLYGMGRTAAVLGVDAASLTGATHLYEGAGMHVSVSYVQYERELRAGIDPSVQSLEGDGAG